LSDKAPCRLRRWDASLKCFCFQLCDWQVYYALSYISAIVSGDGWSFKGQLRDENQEWIVLITAINACSQEFLEPKDCLV